MKLKIGTRSNSDLNWLFIKKMTNKSVFIENFLQDLSPAENDATYQIE